jgi:hypothetical protein
VKTQKLTREQEFTRLFEALRESTFATFAQHERSISDSYVKNRVYNAAWQVLARTLISLYPDVARARDIRVTPWKPTMEETETEMWAKAASSLLELPPVKWKITRVRHRVESSAKTKP